ncbi:MAG TPA: AraC family transcriptional regulator N-terminal domain-containing protein, partial [Pseudomonadales bacterium]|nr:AraC family transcriptional regulator N-terminal domain-containing protein [Pseudomonadales bacterium]
MSVLAFANEMTGWSEKIAAGLILARQHYRLASVKCDSPVLILPLNGSKRLYYSNQIYECAPGAFLLLNGALDASVENIPNENGPYKAWAIPFSWELVNIARALVSTELEKRPKDGQSNAVMCAEVSAKLFDALADHLQLMSKNRSPAEQSVSVLRIMVALHEAGASSFLWTTKPSYSAQFRALVSTQPERDWSSLDFEAAL